MKSILKQKYPHGEKQHSWSTTHSVTKVSPKWVWFLDLKSISLKFLKENKAEQIHNLQARVVSLKKDMKYTKNKGSVWQL